MIITTPAQTIPGTTRYKCDCCGKISSNDILSHTIEMRNRITYSESKYQLCTDCGRKVVDGACRIIFDLRKAAP
jgi:hypothetical protein